MSRTNKKMSKQDFPATQPAKMPNWATSIFSTEEAMELTRALEETPLPQSTKPSRDLILINKPKILPTPIATNNKAAVAYKIRSHPLIQTPV